MYKQKPGVADNKSYKDMYHFNDFFYKSNDRDRFPSIDVDPEINTTIKDNPYRSNVEIEKDEIVLNPDLTALFKANGKKHSGGGIDVMLKPDSFIFSDDKTLAFTEEDHKAFEFKKGGNFKAAKNTPAEVLKRNVDLKHYNTLVSNISDIKKDDLAKKSSSMMLEKYIETLGQIAMVQEAKKDFPTGMPEFSSGTAPVYTGDVKHDVLAQKQYAKYGGPVSNPYMQNGGNIKAQLGKYLPDSSGVVRTIKNADGSTTTFLADGSYQTHFPNGRVKHYNAVTGKTRMSDQSGSDTLLAEEIPGGGKGYVYRDQSKQTSFSNNRSIYQYPTGETTMGTRDTQGNVAWEDEQPGKGQPTMSGAAGRTASGSVPGAAVSGQPKTGQTPAPNVGNPTWGPWAGDVQPFFKNKFGVGNAADKITDMDAAAKELGYTGPKNNLAFQQWLYASSPENKAVIDYWHDKYEDPNITKSPSKRNRFDGKIGIRWQSAIDQIRKRKPPEELIKRREPGVPTLVQPPAMKTDTAEDTIPQPTPVQGQTEKGKEINWQFSPWQKVSHLYNLSKYASAKRYMPYRSRINPAFIDPALVNPEQVVGDLQGAANSSLRALGSMNPIMRNAQAASTYGQLLNQIPGVRSQYDNQNAQILNSTRAQNTQITNAARTQNMQNDQAYYKETVVGRQNFDNMKTFLADNYMNNLMDDVHDNQSLAYNLATMKNPAYGYNFRSGNFYRNPKSILDVDSGTMPDEYEAHKKRIENSTMSENEKIKEINKILGSKRLSAVAKKGGKVKKNPYK